MKFMGSKRRIAPQLLKIMNPLRGNRPWVEPFVGGGNMIELVGGRRIGADIDPNVIKALMMVRDYPELLPKNNSEFTEADYQRLWEKEGLTPAESFAGFAYSYSSKWRGGWRRDKVGERDYVAEAFRNAMEQSPKLQGVELSVCSYKELEIPPQSLIYCDPPYAATTKYRIKGFDHEEFFDWCRWKSKQGHFVFISEYKAPEDFHCLWEKQITSSLDRDTGSKKGVERLFTPYC